MGELLCLSMKETVASLCCRCHWLEMLCADKPMESCLVRVPTELGSSAGLSSAHRGGKWSWGAVVSVLLEDEDTLFLSVPSGFLRLSTEKLMLWVISAVHVWFWMWFTYVSSSFSAESHLLLIMRPTNSKYRFARRSWLCVRIFGPNLEC